MRRSEPMSPLSLRWLTVLVFAAFAGGCSDGEALPSHEEIVRPDFEAILELQDQPCSAVETFEKTDELDYQVTCADGPSYRIRVSPEGNVLVTPHLSR